jgi:hypothetical protein
MPCAAHLGMISPWTEPTTAVGVVYGLVDGEFAGIDSGGEFVFTNAGRDYDRTIGGAICYASESESNREHEMSHADQHETLGMFYAPLHLLMQGGSYLATGTYDDGHPLEWGPNSSPSTPWGLP